MKRWTLPAEATGEDDVVLDDVAVPQPGPGQARLRVSALSINARDRMILGGPFGRTPGRALVPLSDVAGTIDAVGADVDGWAAGDRVMTAHVPAWQDGRAQTFGVGPGSFEDDGLAAELVVVDAVALIAAPATLTDLEASTLQVAGVTAWNSVFGSHPVAKGDLVVVLGSGGVALFAAQLSLAVGADVIAAVRDRDLTTDDRARWAAIGVTDVVTTEPGWGSRLAARTGGAAKIVNSVGPGMTQECVDALGSGGEVAVPGLLDLSSPTLDFTAVISKQVSIRGVAVGSAAMHRALAAFLQEHDLHPVIDTVTPFTDLPQAYRRQAAHGIFGKIVISVTSHA